jgi:hypothetical protein
MFNAKEQIIAYAKYLDAITGDMTIKETAMMGYIDCLWNNNLISAKYYDRLIEALLK